MCMMPMLAFAQAVLPTAWNFSTPGIATPPEGWSYSLGSGSLTYASGVGDNVSIRLDAQAEYLQINFAERPGPVSYYIKGTAITGPAFQGEFNVQESVDGSTWTSVHTFTGNTSASDMTGTLTRYQHNLTATSRYVRFYYTTKVSGSNVQIDSVLIQAPPPPGHGIAVKQGLSTLVNGGTFAFGNAASKLFTIQNIGVSDNLHTDSIVFTGDNASDFSIGAIDSNTGPNNGTDDFTVYFAAGATGSRFATMNVYTNDAERNPFVVNLYAIGGSFATEPATQANAVSITGVRTFTMNVTFGKAPGGADKYIILRKTGNTLTEVPVDGQTYKRGDYIGGAQVAYIGPDSVLLKPNYILAGTDYSFVAFSFNGPEGYENYNTTGATVATTTTLTNEIGSYYSSVTPLVNTFISDLANRIRNPHDTVFYSNYAPTLVNNYLTRDTTGGKKVVNCVYTGAAYIYDEPFLWWNGTNSGILTREHTFAQSWMPSNGGSGSGWPEINGKEVTEYNDLHHLFPANQLTANEKRSNNPFGVVVAPTYTSPTGSGKLGADATGKTVYEPKDSQKGDLARAIFYMLVHYNGIRNNTWRVPATQDIAILLQWHQQDPPDALEIARHEYIASLQHNRNPFIDHPNWVNRINFATMTYIPDPSAHVVSVTAPAANTAVIRNKWATISWTSQNVDSVVVEIQVAPAGPFTLVGKYAATAGSVTRVFNENATNTAVIRISEAANPLVNAVSAAFRIVNPVINITAPADLSELKADSTYTIKWTKQYTDSVSVIYEYQENSSTQSVTAADNRYNIDSFAFVVPDKDLSAVRIIVREKASWKSSSDLAADTINVSFKKWTGLTENTALNHQVTLYPVPSKGLVNVELPANINITSIEAYDITGKLVTYSTKENHITLPSAGLYVIRINTDHGLATKRVIVE